MLLIGPFTVNLTIPKRYSGSPMEARSDTCIARYDSRDLLGRTAAQDCFILSVLATVKMSQGSPATLQIYICPWERVIFQRETFLRSMSRRAFDVPERNVPSQIVIPSSFITWTYVSFFRLYYNVIEVIVEFVVEFKSLIWRLLGLNHCPLWFK